MLQTFAGNLLVSFAYLPLITSFLCCPLQYRKWCVVIFCLCSPLLGSGQTDSWCVSPGAAYACAEWVIRDLVDTTRLPFLPTPMGKGVVPDSHPLSVAAARSKWVPHQLEPHGALRLGVKCFPEECFLSIIACMLTYLLCMAALTSWKLCISVLCLFQCFCHCTAFGSSFTYPCQSDIISKIKVTWLPAYLGIQAIRQTWHGYRMVHMQRWNEPKERHIFHAVFIFLSWITLKLPQRQCLVSMFELQLYPSRCICEGMWIGISIFWQTRNNVWHKHCLNSALQL